MSLTRFDVVTIESYAQLIHRARPPNIRRTRISTNKIKGFRASRPGDCERFSVPLRGVNNKCKLVTHQQVSYIILTPAVEKSCRRTQALELRITSDWSGLGSVGERRERTQDQEQDQEQDAGEGQGVTGGDRVTGGL